MLKRLLVNFSEEKKNEVGLEITVFSIMYLIFIYPEDGFNFRSLTFMDFGFLIVLNLIFLGIYKIMRMG